jgi:hypothetical protein
MKSVLRKMFGPKKGEVTGKSIKLQSDELYALCSSPDIQVIKQRGMRRVNVARIGER